LFGKFDRLNVVSPAPYTAFAEAFEDFAARVLTNRDGAGSGSTNDDDDGGGGAVARSVRAAIRRDLGPEASVLTRIIPGLEPLCGDGSRGVDDPGRTGAHMQAKAAEAIQRFVFVFRRFLRAVASPDRPIVLLLDDIHFAVRARARAAFALVLLRSMHP
jgi:predicted ATPase